MDKVPFDALLLSIIPQCASTRHQIIQAQDDVHGTNINCSIYIRDNRG